MALMRCPLACRVQTKPEQPSHMALIWCRGRSFSLDFWKSEERPPHEALSISSAAKAYIPTHRLITSQPMDNEKGIITSQADAVFVK